ncbi:Uncharacterised protein [Segatella copri]|nr:Uncharacterised protein [Segatella copri]
MVMRSWALSPFDGYTTIPSLVSRSPNCMPCLNQLDLIIWSFTGVSSVISSPPRANWYVLPCFTPTGVKLRAVTSAAFLLAILKSICCAWLESAISEAATKGKHLLFIIFQLYVFCFMFQ